MMRHLKWTLVCWVAALQYGLLLWCNDVLAQSEQAASSIEHVEFDIQLDTVVKHDDGEFLWFHPRLAAFPQQGDGRGPAILMTIQKHLMSASDFYSGLSVLSTNDLGATWQGPNAQPKLAWRDESAEVVVSVCDVTPGWHPQTKKLIAIGIQLRYSHDGKQLLDVRGSHSAAYAVYDPANSTWTRWKTIAMPEDDKFFLVAPGCVQWMVEPDGTILLPFYYRGPEGIVYDTSVMKCRFDGETLEYVEHGDEMKLDVERGLCEPSIIKFRGKYFLTIRNDQDDYVTVSDDGLHYSPRKSWQFDDGTQLGTYNTQQHWLAHSDGLFLVYNRKGANNDHIFRHRAPLFIAQVDPDRLQVIRSTERILVPNRGATLGNHGAAPVSPNESWVSVSEGIFVEEARKQGADGSTFVARVKWAKPNRLFSLAAPTE